MWNLQQAAQNEKYYIAFSRICLQQIREKVLEEISGLQIFRCWVLDGGGAASQRNQKKGKYHGQ